MALADDTDHSPTPDATNEARDSRFTIRDSRDGQSPSTPLAFVDDRRNVIRVSPAKREAFLEAARAQGRTVRQVALFADDRGNAIPVAPEKREAFLEAARAQGRTVRELTGAVAEGDGRESPAAPAPAPAPAPTAIPSAEDRRLLALAGHDTTALDALARDIDEAAKRRAEAAAPDGAGAPAPATPEMRPMGGAPREDPRLADRSLGDRLADAVRDTATVGKRAVVNLAEGAVAIPTLAALGAETGLAKLGALDDGSHPVSALGLRAIGAMEVAKAERLPYTFDQDPARRDASGASRAVAQGGELITEILLANAASKGVAALARRGAGAAVQAAGEGVATAAERRALDAALKATEATRPAQGSGEAAARAYAADLSKAYGRALVRENLKEGARHFARAAARPTYWKTSIASRGGIEAYQTVLRNGDSDDKATLYALGDAALNYLILGLGDGAGAFMDGAQATLATQFVRALGRGGSHPNLYGALAGTALRVFGGAASAGGSTAAHLGILQAAGAEMSDEEKLAATLTATLFGAVPGALASVRPIRNAILADKRLALLRAGLGPSPAAGEGPAPGTPPPNAPAGAPQASNLPNLQTSAGASAPAGPAWAHIARTYPSGDVRFRDGSLWRADSQTFLMPSGAVVDPEGNLLTAAPPEAASSASRESPIVNRESQEAAAQGGLFGLPPDAPAGAPQASRAAAQPQTFHGHLPNLQASEGEGGGPATLALYDLLRDADVRVHNVPLGQIQVNRDIKQFKAEADPRTGVVQGEELQGEFQAVPAKPILLLEKLDGSLEVVTGRHRLDLARRNNLPAIPANIIRMRDGWTLDMARALDAYDNILDEKGSDRDFIDFFRRAQIDRDTAQAKGLLARRKGRDAFDVAEFASEDLYALAMGDARMDAPTAAAIAREAPVPHAAGQSAQGWNQNIQAAVSRAVLEDGLRADDAAIMARSLRQAYAQRIRERGLEQLDLFGNDDTFILAMTVEAKFAAQQIRQIDFDLRGLKTAAGKQSGNLAARDSLIKKYRLKGPEDRDGMARAIATLEEQKRRWQNYHTDPELAELAHAHAKRALRLEAIEEEAAAEAAAEVAQGSPSRESRIVSRESPAGQSPAPQPAPAAEAAPATWEGPNRPLPDSGRERVPATMGGAPTYAIEDLGPAPEALPAGSVVWGNIDLTPNVRIAYPVHAYGKPTGLDPNTLIGKAGRDEALKHEDEVAALSQTLANLHAQAKANDSDAVKAKRLKEIERVSNEIQKRLDAVKAIADKLRAPAARYGTPAVGQHLLAPAQDGTLHLFQIAERGTADSDTLLSDGSIVHTRQTGPDSLERWVTDPSGVDSPREDWWRRRNPDGTATPYTRQERDLYGEEDLPQAPFAPGPNDTLLSPEPPEPALGAYGLTDEQLNGPGFQPLAKGENAQTLRHDKRSALHTVMRNEHLGVQGTVGTVGNAKKLASSNSAGGENPNAHRYAQKNLPALYAQAEVAVRHKNKKLIQRKTDETYVRLFAPFVYEGKTYVALISQRESRDPGIHAVEVLKVIEADALPPTYTSRAAGQEVPSVTAPSAEPSAPTSQSIANTKQNVKSPGNGKPQSALTAEKIAYTLGDVKLTDPTHLDGTPYAPAELLADVRAAVARFEDRARLVATHVPTADPANPGRFTFAALPGATLDVAQGAATLTLPTGHTFQQAVALVTAVRARLSSTTRLTLQGTRSRFLDAYANPPAAQPAPRPTAGTPPTQSQEPVVRRPGPAYRGSHRAPRRADITGVDDTTVPLRDWAKIVPGDTFAHPERYFGANASALESARLIARALAGKAKTITVYRAIPAGLPDKRLNDGDWVTPSKAYAQAHGQHALNGNYRILAQRVAIDDLFWNGDSPAELGYASGRNPAPDTLANPAPGAPAPQGAQPISQSANPQISQAGAYPMRGEVTPHPANLGGAPGSPAREHARIPLALPDLVLLYKELAEGAVPRVIHNRALMDKALGRYRVGQNAIELAGRIFGIVDDSDLTALRDRLRARGLFRNEDPAWCLTMPRAAITREKQISEERLQRELRALMTRRVRAMHDALPAAKVMAHELWHLIDDQDGGLRGRGDLVGHLAALKHAAAQALPEPAFADQPALVAEAKAFIQWWRGLDGGLEASRFGGLESPATRATGEAGDQTSNPPNFQTSAGHSPAYEPYFDKPEEMYAEIGAAYFCAPEDLKARAPKCHAAWEAALERHPAALEALIRARAYIASGGRDQRLARELAATWGREYETALRRYRRDTEGFDNSAAAWWDRTLAALWDDRAPALNLLKRAVRDAKAENKRAAKDDPAAAETLAEADKRLDALLLHARLNHVLYRRKGPNNARLYLADVKGDFLRALDAIAPDRALARQRLELYATYKRAIELGGRPMPLGLTPGSARAGLAAMLRDVGPRGYRAIARAWGTFRALYERDVVERPATAELLGPDFVDLMRRNTHYVTLRHTPTPEALAQATQRAHDDPLSAAAERLLKTANPASDVAKILKPLKGSLEPVKNPLLETMRTAVAIIVAAERNQIVIDWVRALRELHAPDILERDGQHTIANPRLGTIDFWERGQHKTLIVPRRVAAGFEHATPTWLRSVTAATRLLNAALTTNNPGFVPIAQARDLASAAYNIRGLHRWPLHWIPAAGDAAALLTQFIPPAAMRAIGQHPLGRLLLNPNTVEYWLAFGNRMARLIHSGDFRGELERARQDRLAGRDAQAREREYCVQMARRALQDGILLSMAQFRNQDLDESEWKALFAEYSIDFDEPPLNPESTLRKTLLAAPRALRALWNATGTASEIASATTKLAVYAYLDQTNPTAPHAPASAPDSRFATHDSRDGRSPSSTLANPEPEPRRRPTPIASTAISGQAAEKKLEKKANIPFENKAEHVVAFIKANQRRKLVSDDARAKSRANGFSDSEHLQAAVLAGELFQDARLIEDRPGIIREGRDAGNEDPNVRIQRYAADITIQRDSQPIDATAYLTVKVSTSHRPPKKNQNEQTPNRIYSLELLELRDPRLQGKEQTSNHVHPGARETTDNKPYPAPEVKPGADTLANPAPGAAPGATNGAGQAPGSDNPIISDSDAKAILETIAWRAAVLAGDPTFDIRGSLLTLIETVFGPFVNAGLKGTFRFVQTIADTLPDFRLDGRPRRRTPLLNAAAYAGKIGATLTARLILIALSTGGLVTAAALALFRKATGNPDATEQDLMASPLGPAVRGAERLGQAYRNISTYLLQNYNCLPLYHDGDITIALTLPIGDEERVPILLLDAALNKLRFSWTPNPATGPADVAGQLLGAPVNSLRGQGTLIQYAYLLSPFLFNYNPYDNFRGHTLLPADEFAARWDNPAAAATIANRLIESTPLAIAWKPPQPLTPEQQASLERTPWLGRFHATLTRAPLLSTIAGRLIRVQIGGEADRIRRLRRLDQQQALAIRLLARQNFALTQLSLPPQIPQDLPPEYAKDYFEAWFARQDEHLSARSSAHRRKRLIQDALAIRDPHLRARALHALRHLP